MKKIKLKKDVKFKLITSIVTFVFICCIIFGYMFYENMQLKKAEIIVNKPLETLYLYNEQSSQIDVKAKEQKYADKIQYKSSNIDVLSIDNFGKIVALKPGNAMVQVGIEGSTKWREIAVVVKEHVYKIKGFEKKEITEKENLQLFAYDETIKVKSNQLDWISSHPEVASIDKNGKIVALKVGKANISINKDGKKMDSVDFEIKKKIVKVEKILISNIDKCINIEKGNTFSIKATALPIEATHQELHYSSMNSQIANVSKDGVIHAKNIGQTKIKIMSGDSEQVVLVDIKVVEKAQHVVVGPFVNNTMLDAAGIGGTSKLMIVAHPDDETLWGGGHLVEGQWFVVCLTNGNNKRKMEFENALNYLGVRGIILSYPDLVNHKRNDWKGVKNNVLSDIEVVLKYKNWSTVATHSPKGEYGHIHHQMTSRYTTQVVKKLGLLPKLYYFGQFYKPGKIPSDLIPNLSESQRLKKTEALQLFTSQLKAIQQNWSQMIPYEHWRKA